MIKLKKAQGLNLLEKRANPESGVLKIKDNVIASIASLAARDVKGVIAVYGGIYDYVVNLVDKRSMPGVKVDIAGEEVRVNIGVIVEFGVSIPQLAAQIQEMVKGAIEKMTGISSVEVDVNVKGVREVKR